METKAVAEMSVLLVTSISFPRSAEAILPCDDAATRICFLGGGNSNMFYFHPEIWGR